MFACDVMWSHVYLSIYPPNHLCIYLSIYRASYRPFPYTLIQICNPLLAFGLKIEDSTETPSSNLQSSGGTDDPKKKSCGIFILKGKRLPSVYPFHSIPSVHPSIHLPMLSIHPSFPFIYISTYLAICSPIYLPIYLAIYLSIHPSNYTFIQRCNPWVACGLKIQERTIFSPKKGTEGTDNKKHWEASKPTIKQNCTGFDTY